MPRKPFRRALTRRPRRVREVSKQIDSGRVIPALRPLPKKFERSGKHITAYLITAQYFNTSIPVVRRDLRTQMRSLKGKFTPKERVDLFRLLEWLLDRKSKRIGTYREDLFELFPTGKRILKEDAEKRSKRKK